MDLKLFATIFASVFVAELGDKTQLATMLFAAKGEVSKWNVFFAASLALVVSTALGVVAGQVLSAWISPRALQIVAGIGFLAIGAVTLWRA